jgi:methyltransferase (TIGR00027 family)
VTRRRSLTAEGVAAFRARARFEPGSLRGDDQLASRLIGWKLRVLATTPLLRDVMLTVYERVLPGAYFYMMARTKYLDEFVMREVQRGAEQVVILGAGLDSRAYRLPGLERCLVFEVDHPGTQAWKRERVAAALGAVPNHVRFVPVDFAREQVADRLAANGYVTEKPTCVLWEGVMMYLPSRAVDETFSFLARTPRLALGFDYILSAAFTDPQPFHGAREGMAYVARRGESYQSGLNDALLGEYLRERGFVLEDHLHAADLERRYLRDPDGHLRGRVCAHFVVASARAGNSKAL